MWVYWVLTSLSTVYFGWHYLLDDIAGFGIGLFAVWVGAKMTGHKMEVQRHRGSADDGLVGVFPPQSSKADAGAADSASPVAAGAGGRVSVRQSTAADQPAGTASSDERKV
jgi:hypothetical protein